jgi:hypothetical protein
MVSIKYVVLYGRSFSPSAVHRKRIKTQRERTDQQVIEREGVPDHEVLREADAARIHRPRRTRFERCSHR